MKTNKTVTAMQAAGAVLGGASAPVTLSLDPPVAPPTGSLH